MDERHFEEERLRAEEHLPDEDVPYFEDYTIDGNEPMFPVADPQPAAATADEVITGSPPPVNELQRGLARLAYHKALLELVQATEQWAGFALRALDAAKLSDPDNSAGDRPEELVAAQSVQAILVAVGKKAPEMRALFAAAAGDFQLAIPG